MKRQNALTELMGYAGKRRYLTYASWVLSAISALVGLLPFYYIWRILDEVLRCAPDFALAVNTVHFGWRAVWTSLAAMLIYFGALMCSHLSAFRVAGNLRKRTMRHIATLPPGFLSEMGTGRARRIVQDSSAATETFLAHQLPDIAGAVASLLGMAVILFAFDWRFGLASIAPFILSFVFMYGMAGPSMAADMGNYHSALEAMSNEAVEYVRGVPVVKTFGQTVFSFKRFKGAIDDYYRFVMAYCKKCRPPMLRFQLASNSVFAFLIAVALMALSGGVERNVVLTGLLFYTIFTPVVATMLNKVMLMSEHWMTVNDTLARIHTILDAQPLPEPLTPREAKGAEVAFDHVCFRYDGAERDAVHDLSFSIRCGQSVALVGPSGGGKTTAAALLSRFWDVQSGSISIGGVNVCDMGAEQLARCVGYVFQDSKLLKTSILENVRLARPDASREEVLDALHRAQCDDLIAKLPNGIDTVIGAKGVFLSGGEQQRVAIARVILKDAPVLVLDEATAFADPENEALVQRAFQEMARDKTVLMIAHRLTTVRRADCIHVLVDGSIVESGNHDALIERDGIYAKMWRDYQTSIKWKVGGAA